MTTVKRTNNDTSLNVAGVVVNIRLALLSDLLQGQIFSKPSGMGEETYDLEGGGGEGEMAFSDKVVRRGFIKKVYSIISVQVEKTNMCFMLNVRP